MKNTVYPCPGFKGKYGCLIHVLTYIILLMSVNMFIFNIHLVFGYSPKQVNFDSNPNYVTMQLGHCPAL